MVETQKVIEEDEKKKTITQKILEEDEKKKTLANEKNYEQFIISVKFTNPTNQEVKQIQFCMLENERLSKFFSTIKMIIPGINKFYIICTYNDTDGINSAIDETSEEALGFFGGAICNHINYKNYYDFGGA